MFTNRFILVLDMPPNDKYSPHFASRCTRPLRRMVRSTARGRTTRQTRFLAMPSLLGGQSGRFSCDVQASSAFKTCPHVHQSICFGWGSRDTLSRESADLLGAVCLDVVSLATLGPQIEAWLPLDQCSVLLVSELEASLRTSNENR